MIRVKRLTQKGFVQFIWQNPENVRIGLPSVLCKGGEAKQQGLAAVTNKERAA